MKPEDLKHHFTFNERKVIIDDRILYIPNRCSCYEEFLFPGWTSLFQNLNPVHVEYCSGNGAWIADKAFHFPETNWVAVEKKFERVRKIWSKMKNHNLNNLLIICGDARIATRYYFPKETVQEIFINFPDPWPKKRHAKHRLMQKQFIQDVLSSMNEGGAFTLATDDPDYSRQSIKELRQFESLIPLYQDPYFITDLNGYGTSYFEQLWKEKGRTIRYHVFQKKAF